MVMRPFRLILFALALALPAGLPHAVSVAAGPHDP
jgi:hypothetical protein